MITKDEAKHLAKHRSVYSGEQFSGAVLRMDREIREAAESGSDGVCSCFNPKHIPALAAIAREYGFTTMPNRDDFRLHIVWS